MCRDISLNHGPVKNPCGKCNRPVAKNHRAVQCEACYYWLHIKCESISPAEYISLCGDDDPWTCKDCSGFHFTDSFFEYDENIESPSNKLNHSTNSADTAIFDQLTRSRRKYPKRFLCAHLNINSLRHKFDYIKELLIKNTVDVLFIAETKLDDSFVNAQFMVDNYHLWRADCTQNGGGVAAFLISNIAGDKRSDLEFKHIEGINIEVNLSGMKWLISGAYKPPPMSDELFEMDCTSGIDKISEKYENFILLGYLNFDMLDRHKSEKLRGICNIFDLSNAVKDPICFTSVNKPSLLDVILVKL